MRKTLFATATFALVCALAASAAAPDAPVVVPEQPEVDGLDAIAVPDACSQPATAPPAGDETAPLFLAPPPPEWSCPFGAPRCSEDDDCDAYCGDPQFGSCNSFTGCCTCTG